MKSAKTLLLTILCFYTLPSFGATVYECTDNNGRRTYSQYAGKNCKSSNLGKPSLYTSAAPSAAAEKSGEMPSENKPHDADIGSSRAAKISAARAAVEEARNNLEKGRQVRYGNERNYARYQERIAGLEQSLHTAEKKLQKLNDNPADQTASGNQVQ